ncbi:glutaredoxin domain-containing protein [Geomonas limicola]|nr:glutaredoxin domain-containing protein [Geomonas limicola]
MMRILTSVLLAAALVWGGMTAQAGDLKQSPLPAKSAQKLKYPKVILYSASWCPHCKAAKEYFTKNNIPFINRDVELDPAAMAEVTDKYKSQGVPLIVLGDDAVVLKGFSEARFEKAVEKLKKK